MPLRGRDSEDGVHILVPDPIETRYLTLLDFPAPAIRVYPRELVVAEKYHAVVVLGIANSRMKDFFDLWSLAGKFFDGKTLCHAIEATFRRRRARQAPAGAPPRGRRGGRA